MHKWILITVFFLVVAWDGVSAQECITCHELKTPGIVRDWKISRHAEQDVDCVVCHGDEHSGIDDVREARIPTPAVCAPCHETQVTQYSKGKHAQWEMYSSSKHGVRALLRQSGILHSGTSAP